MVPGGAASSREGDQARAGEGCGPCGGCDGRQGHDIGQGEGQLPEREGAARSPRAAARVARAATRPARAARPSRRRCATAARAGERGASVEAQHERLTGVGQQGPLIRQPRLTSSTMLAARLSRPTATTVRHDDHTGAGDRELAGLGVTDASCRQRRARVAWPARPVPRAPTPPSSPTTRFRPCRRPMPRRQSH